MSPWLIVFLAKYYVGFLVFAVAVFCVSNRKHLRREFWIRALGTGILAFVLSRVVSRFFYNARPFVENGTTPLVFHVPDNGFPSDHALLTAWLVAVVCPYNRRLAFGLAVGAVLVGMGRVLAQVHHVEDVLGSFAIVAVSAVIAALVRKGKK